ncbi:RNA polymerase sigma factor [Rugosimonospora africana]|uniref:RNA polymerase subunit sigma-24 n=1 Tax=Rugosimonospora africana TaxID=556532 RepID=A0A8J3QNN1_9ACTN|nr:sigma-70 family RNA polymerase sigma factor [Rugosimonospora africana]GIH14490.1 RNA polymerase subunit sigma-24 [Rugosimonospora africana]
MPDVHDRLAETVRVEGARILATLVRTIGDLQIAEDAVQEAALVAMRDWPRTGVPEQPRAWLTVAARRKAIDILRREGLRAAKERDGADLIELTATDPPPDHVVRDDQLRLIFTCCHPALSLEARVALALRTLCGLTMAQIAAVLLTNEPAMAKRLTRTRQKIAAARIPYRVPSAAQLPGRVGAVCGVVHALYTAGHAPRSGEEAVDVDLCDEAVRLGRLLRRLLPDEPMPAAVLALMLLTEARRPARVDRAGDVVPLFDQDRSRWDAALIAQGRGLLDFSLRRTEGIADPYQLQAAIAAEHSRAPSYRATDWPEIVRLYDLLCTVAPSPAAALSRAVAVAEASGTGAGLAALEAVPPSERWHAVRAELLARAGRYPEAIEAVTASLDGEATEAERRYRQRLRARWMRESAT